MNESNWISVRERFPSEPGNYLTYHDDGWDITSYNGRMLGFKRSLHTNPMTWFWMPLPTPPTARGASGWVSVSDDLPKEPFRYMVYRNGKIEISSYDTKNGFWHDGVSHWRTLPRLPGMKDLLIKVKP